MRPELRRFWLSAKTSESRVHDSLFSSIPFCKFYTHTAQKNANIPSSPVNRGISFRVHHPSFRFILFGTYDVAGDAIDSFADFAMHA